MEYTNTTPNVLRGIYFGLTAVAIYFWLMLSMTYGFQRWQIGGVIIVGVVLAATFIYKN